MYLSLSAGNHIQALGCSPPLIHDKHLLPWNNEQTRMRPFMNHICRFTNKNNGEVSQARETKPDPQHSRVLTSSVVENASLPGFFLPRTHSREKGGQVGCYSPKRASGRVQKAHAITAEGTSDSLGLGIGNYCPSGRRLPSLFKVAPAPMVKSRGLEWS